MLERDGVINRSLSQSLGKLIPESYKPLAKRTVYNVKDFLRFGISNISYYGSADMFGHVYFEANTACDWNRCWYCPQSSLPKSNEIMSNEIFNTMVSQLSELGVRGYRGIIGPVFFNEPTMLGDRLVDMMDLIRRNLPLSWIQLNTNGIKLTPEFARNLLDVGVSQIIVTKHPGAPTKNIERVQNGLYYEINRGRIVIRTLDKVKLWNRGGLMDIPKEKRLRLKRCRMASDQLTINIKGDVLFCCNDYTANYKEGNIVTENMVDVWRKKEFVGRREQARLGEYSLSLCKSCMMKNKKSI